MDRGLAAPNQTLKMIPSFVVNLPKGSETGTYLALDLGGSNFRVCEVTLEGAGSSGAVSNVRMRQRKYVVSDDLKTGRGTDLFDFFADCVREFLVENGIHATDPAHNELVLGFTFSFPCSQTAINKGALMHWTKGFTASGVEGQDPVQLLQDAFHRKQLRVRVASLVNDTVGTLVAHAYQDPSTHLGIILGTGTNAAYVERIDRIPKWDGPIPASGKMIVNTEWGAFDQEGVVLPLTSYDSVLDRQSAHPHLQTYEKMVSGLYLGEVMRLVLADLASTGELFRGVSSTVLTTPYSIDTALMSRIERDHSAELADVRVVLEDLISIPKTSAEDRRIVKRVAELIGTRSARLAAAGVAAIVSKINRLDDCTVAIDGSLFEHYPHYANRMRDALREIVGIAADNILLVQARDGSGQGAALIAALADA
nr:hexokinase A [Polyrhizophydium stewartii]